MKILKFLLQIMGVGFLIGGVIYFSNLFSVGGLTNKFTVLMIRLINAAAWIAAGYGLIRLKQWSLYCFGLMIALHLITALYNLYFSSVSKETLNLTVPAIQIVVLLFLATNKDKLFNK